MTHKIENDMSCAYFDALDALNTLNSLPSWVGDTSRVHGGTENEDTLKDLLENLVEILKKY
jgi:hypothetical protein|tara:strand:+ start:407 stop:589 length:183 start_codon:yes stop_codon:yes gene_type:complete